MIEKVNPMHPDKICDRIAGAIVDLAYEKDKNPKVAAEVLIGHGSGHIIIETSADISKTEVDDIVKRLAGNIRCYINILPQDVHLSENQKEFISVEGADYEHDEQEREANKFAMNQLIPEETWNRIMKEGCTDLSPYKIVKTIATKAKLYGISPSIAVSRYKHDTNWYQTNSYRSPKIH